MKIAAKTNPRYTALISMLKETSRANGSNVWREIAKRLEAPSRNYAEVNLSKISRYAREGETVIVPGKVLGSGILTAGVSVAALSFSESAVDKINDASGNCMTIEDLVKKNPEGKLVRILR
ncbi:50S ribosomal protein L18e [Methanoplanus sp. FWC-SCC4]|uniref:Large ribosomal subunit protein eL18 n=1 Tax=Methanochimaera problematica TaxID=2609417 RepID=A0AA97I4M5_9EURY|nr:50S ribosomal protein L18e [Methanoplanus sp. FWC-SCC4]WOF16516.1 50S ribosomal protein L18e [Methanoplanus sp. FWC-SCC4]